MAAALVVGCAAPTLPDPNDPKDVGQLSPESIQRNLKATSDMLNARQARGEITPDEARTMIAQRANELLDSLDLTRIDKAKASEYGDILVTAKRWNLAQEALTIAVKNPESESQWVVDSLRLARAMVELGKIKEGIPVVRTTFKAGSTEIAPILPAVLLEIVPAAENKGFDAELAKLVEDSIAQHERVLVDPASEGGRMFLQARPFHINNAWAKAARLYMGAGRSESAEKAMLAGEKAARNNVRT